MPALSDTAVRNAKPDSKPYKLTDGDGLYLLVKDTGKYWRFNYRFAGKQKTLALGVYPDVTLKAAREKLLEARRLLAGEIDPGMAKRLQKAARREAATNSFEAVAREWFAKYSPNWAKGHADKIIARLENDIFPWLGSRPISEITPPELLAALRRIEDRGVLETAHRAKQNCGQIFRYGVATGRCDRDPSQDLKGALPPVKTTHFAAITEPKRIGELLLAIEGYQGSLIVKSALRLAPLLFVRPGELRMAQWKDINLDTAEWQFVVSKTKSQHIVPLCTQAVDILRKLEPLTGHGDLVFPGNRGQGRPMSENTVNAALRYLGYDNKTITSHGFRAMARTVLDEVLGFPPHIIEHQLAHAVRDPLGRAYNRTSHLAERKRMMQEWADYLDGLRHSAEEKV